MFGGSATIIPEGRLSVKLRLPTAPPVLFSMVKLSVDLSPTFIVFGVNDLLNKGTSPSTFKTTLLVPELPRLLVRSPVVIVWGPMTVPVTFTSNKQELLAPKEPPVNVIVLPPSKAVKLVPAPESTHPMLGAPGVAITTPAGKFVVRFKLVIATGSLLKIVNLKVETEPGAIED